MGSGPCIAIGSAQETRALLTERRAIQKAAIDVELSLRGVLRNFGLKLGRISKDGFAARVRELAAGNAMLETMAEAMLRARAALRAELAGLERRLRDLAKQDAACRIMMTMPGVGPQVALTVKSAIDAPERFRSSKDVGPWVGLTPGRRPSGKMDVIGSVARAGDAGLRAALYQTATVNDASRQAVLAEGLGPAGRPAARDEAGGGRHDAPNRRDPAPDVGGRRGLPPHPPDRGRRRLRLGSPRMRDRRV